MTDSRYEPSFHELLNDPIVQLLMARDGVDPTDLYRMMDSLRPQFAKNRRQMQQMQQASSDLVN